MISYATIVWLEPGFMLIHTVIDLIWSTSALIKSSSALAEGPVTHYKPSIVPSTYPNLPKPTQYLPKPTQYLAKLGTYPPIVPSRYETIFGRYSYFGLLWYN